MLSSLAFILFSSAFAGVVGNTVLTTTIEKVDISTSPTEPTLVFAHKEGRVLLVDSTDTKMVEAFSIAQKDNFLVKVEIDTHGNVIGAKLAGQSKVKAASRFKIQAQAYEPTVISSLETADEYFWEMNGRAKKRSQCFNRAHVWANDMWNRHSVKSMKVFLFFTTKYIRQYRYKWWFHVSPYVLVDINGKAEERVLDRAFTDAPYEMKAWTDEFMQNEAYCPTVAKYSEYNNNQYAQSCYLMKVPMYYWEPNNLELMETETVPQRSWNQSEVSTAWKQAFTGWW